MVKRKFSINNVLEKNDSMGDDEENYELEPLEITIKIYPTIDETLFNSLKSVDRNKRDEKVLSWLRIGELVSTLVVAQTSDTSIESYFKPILGKMDELKDTIDSMKGDFTKSEARGHIGEEIIKSQFINYFAKDGDTFTVVSDAGHQADIHADMFVEKPDKGKEAVPILIEAKLYQNTVQTSEVDKFWTDLIGNSTFQWGLFVSLSSEISTIPAPIYVNSRKGKVGIFVTNKGTNQILHIVVWALLREMIRAQLAEGKAIESFRKFDIERVARIVKTRLELIRKELDKIEELNRSAKFIQNDVIKHTSSIFFTSAELRKGLETQLEEFYSEFNKEVKELVSGTPPEIPGWSPNKWVKITETSTDKHSTILEVIRTYLSGLGEKFKIYNDDKDNSTIICRYADEKKPLLEIKWVQSSIKMRVSPNVGLDYNKYKDRKSQTGGEIKIENGWLVLEGKPKKKLDFPTEVCNEIIGDIKKIKERGAKKVTGKKIKIKERGAKKVTGK